MSKRSKKKKRKLSPEHIQKMQEGRKKARVKRKWKEQMKEMGIGGKDYQSKYEKMIEKMCLLYWHKSTNLILCRK